MLPARARAQSDVAPVPGRSAPDVQVPADVRDLVERIETDLDAWDVAGAREAVDALSKRVQGSAVEEGLWLMQAKVDFFEGRYVDAVKLYEKGGAESHPGGYRRLAEDALAQTEKDVHVQSEHFDLYYPPGKDAVLGPYALETLEKALAALQQDFEFTPPGRIRVEILPDDEALSRLSTLTLEQIRTTGTIAICKFNRLMIISPRALVRGYDWRDTLNHELVHLVVSMKSRNTVPIWLHEGLAKFEETRWRGAGGQAATPYSEFLLGQAVKKQKLITFEQMHPSMALLPSQEDAATAFAEVFHAIEFLQQKGGTATWRAIIANLRAGQSYPEAVAHAYHAPFERFVADWKAYLASRKYPSDPGGGEPALTFKGAAGKKPDAVESTELVDFQDVKDPQSRKWAHLGGLLMQRKHLDAAIEELGKAYVKGAGSEQLDARYAAALIQGSRFDLAKKVLTESLQKNPRRELTELYFGQLLLRQGDYAGARDHLLVGIDTDPFDPRLHEGLLDAYEKLGDTAHAKQASEALAALEPTSAKAPASAPGAEPGSVMLASHPYAQVAVDGHPSGKTTPTVLTLPPGKHHVVLTSEERGLRKELDLDVASGQSQELRLELDDDAPKPSAATPATR